MNKWARKTVQLAREGDYLDRLHEVYPIEPKKRVVDQKSLDEIRNAFKKRDEILLLNKLLDLEKFPYDDSYVAFLRKDRSAIKRNPKTVDRIYSTLVEMGIEGIVQGIAAPKEANTRRGNSFKQWLRAKFRFGMLSEFERVKQGIIFLDAPETTLRNYVNSKLGAGFQKRPDFLAKTGARHMIGEAKFLSDLGGNQARGFADAITVAANPAHGGVKVCVLDGIVWIQSRSHLYSSIENSSINVFSALLLKDFLVVTGKK